MYNMAKNKGKKWTSTIILKSLLKTVQEFCEDDQNGFANASQFINHAVRRELEIRSRKSL